MDQALQGGRQEQATIRNDYLKKVIAAMDGILARVANLKLLLKGREPGQTIAPDLLEEAWSILYDFESLFAFWSEAAREQNVPLSTIEKLKDTMDRFEELLASKGAEVPKPAACPRQERDRDH